MHGLVVVAIHQGDALQLKSFVLSCCLSIEVLDVSILIIVRNHHILEIVVMVVNCGKIVNCSHVGSVRQVLLLAVSVVSTTTIEAIPTVFVHY